MSNHGQLPFGTAFQPSASAATPGGFPYSTMPQYASQQQSLKNYALPQSHPSGAFPPNRPSTYAYSANGQRGTPNAFRDENDQPTFTIHGEGIPYDPRHPSNLSTSSDLSFDPSPFTALPPAQSTMTSSSSLLQNAKSDSFNHRQPYNVLSKTLETGGHNSAPLERELEDGELSSGAMSEGELPVDENPSLNDTFHTKLNQHKEPDLYLPMGDYEAAQMLVRELYSWGFSFQDIMAEVTDGEALQKIFKAVGLSTDCPPKPRPESSVEPSIDLSSSITKGVPRETRFVRRVAADDAVDSVPAMVGQKENSQSLDMTEEGKIAQAANGSQPLDRKALIAQKLAAKKAKPPLSIAAAQTSLGKSVENVQIINSEASRIPPISLDASIKPLPAIPDQQSSKSSTAMPEEHESERRAHTELARQRMEALKRKAATKQGISVQSDDRSNQALSPTVKNSQEAPADDQKDNQARRTEVPTDAPSRRESYFSPVSQKPVFSIPGLFSMTAPKPDEQSQTIFDQQQSNVHPTVTSYDVDRQMMTTTSMSESGVPAPSHSTPPIEEPSNTSSRKRSQASDFFDSSAARVRKSLNQQDVGVIIDISDEESAQSEDDRQSDNAYIQTNSTFHTKNRPDPRSITPPGELPPQNLPPTMSTIATPLVTFTPKGQEPKELKSKELEIELMNRKIAELEASIRAKKAKQTANRSQSPVFTGQLAPREETVKSVTGNPEISATPSVNHLLQNADLTNSISREASTPSGKLFKEASVDNESKRRHNVGTTGINDQVADNEAKETEREGSAEHSVIAEAADQLETLRIPGQINNHFRSDPSTPWEDPLISPKPSQLEEEGTTREDKRLIAQRQARQAEIKNGLPLLNEEIERTRQKLQSLREQEANLENEIKNGLEGRQMLLDELSRLSQATVSDAAANFEETVKLPSLDAHLTHYPSPTDVSHHVVRVDINEDGQIRQIGKESISASDIDGKSVNPEIFSPDHPSRAAITPDLAQSQLADALPPIAADDLSEGELEEDKMDISRSDVDDGEVTSNGEDSSSGNYEDGDLPVVEDHQTIENEKRDITPADTDVGYVPTTNEEIIELDKSQNSNGVNQDEPMEEAINLEDEEIYEPPNSFSSEDEISLPASSHHDHDIDEALQEPLSTNLNYAANRSQSDALSETQHSEKSATSEARKYNEDNDQDDQQIVSYKPPQIHQSSEDDDSGDDYEPPEPTTLDESSLQAIPPPAVENTASVTSPSDANSNDVREMITNTEKSN